MSGIRPIHYKLSMEPDLERFQFVGTAEIALETGLAVQEIVLNVLDLIVTACWVRRAEALLPCVLSSDLNKEELNIRLPEAINGQFVLVVNYHGQINDSMAGFYRSSYVHQGSRRFVAITQFQESDARRAFPCLYHPSQKATFDIEIIVVAGLSAVSYAAV